MKHRRAGLEAVVNYLDMRNFRTALVLTAALITPVLSKKADNPFIGRWDLVVTPSKGTAFPGWMEVVENTTANFGPAPAPRRQRASGGEVKIDGPLLLLTLVVASGKSAGHGVGVHVARRPLTGMQKRGDTVAGANRRSPRARK